MPNPPTNRFGNLDNPEGERTYGVPPEVEEALKAQARAKLHAYQMGYFFKEKPTIPFTMEIEIGKLSWDKANEFMPILLLGRRKREELGIEQGDLVVVTANSRIILCGVDKQFRGHREVATLNYHLAYLLDVELGDNIKIGKLVVPIPNGLT